MQRGFSTYGAVDLGALAARSAPAGSPPGGAGTSDTGPASYVVAVTEATFQAEVVDRSNTVPVVIDFWADWCGPCKQLTPILERLAADYAGRFVLATIDVEANPRIQAAAGVQSIPTVIGVVGGQAVPLFVGALPEPQVRQYVDALLAEAGRLGVTGTAPGDAAGAGSDGDGQPGEPPLDPRLEDAYDAIERGDYDAAAAAYQSLLADAPTDPDARAGLLQVDLLRRTAALDPAAARAAASAAPDDVDAQLRASDADLLENRVDDAFARLLVTVRSTSGDERDRVRRRLLDLFDLLGPDDPRVPKARAALMSALF